MTLMRYGDYFIENNDQMDYIPGTAHEVTCPKDLLVMPSALSHLL